MPKQSSDSPPLAKGQRGEAPICNTCNRPITAPGDIERHCYRCSRCHDASPKRRFAKAKRRAAERELPFTLSLDEYCALIALPCHYCNGQLGTVSTRGGLDRLDNAKGYEPGNCVSCCWACNSTRGETWTPEEARAMIQLGLRMRATQPPDR